LSRRLIIEELLDVLGLGVDIDFGGEPDMPRGGEVGVVLDVAELGNARRYQPPVYVRAMS
jgi:hypothetical protein